MLMTDNALQSWILCFPDFEKSPSVIMTKGQTHMRETVMLSTINPRAAVITTICMIEGMARMWVMVKSGFGRMLMQPSES